MENSEVFKVPKKDSRIYKCARMIILPFFKLFYFLKIKKYPEFPTGRCIICANHSALKDPLLLAFIQKRQVYFMAKSELFENKFLAWLIKLVGAFPVKRNKSDVKSVSYAEELLENEKIVGIFIEGTRSKDGNLLPPKSGAVMIAYKTNTPIVPVSISQKSGKIMRLFRKTTVNVGKPLYPKDLMINEGRPSEYRIASRLVMQKIKELRQEDVKIPQCLEAENS
ncbi:MAG: lysophospholipid acyltransferase family protein [Clostridia bacterium]|nr:lysophospholipid acyltransferase family protein [Clostridia bacterium]